MWSSWKSHIPFCYKTSSSAPVFCCSTDTFFDFVLISPLNSIIKPRVTSLDDLKPLKKLRNLQRTTNTDTLNEYRCISKQGHQISDCPYRSLIEAVKLFGGHLVTFFFLTGAEPSLRLRGGFASRLDPVQDVASCELQMLLCLFSVYFDRPPSNSSRLEPRTPERDVLSAYF